MHPPQSFQLTLAPTGVATITLNRPERMNALTFEVYEELRDTFAALDSMNDVRAVVITGEGRAFCSGGDVNSIIGELFARDMKGLVAFTRVTGALIKNIRACRRPVVAAVNGTAVGAGAVIALACDFRIASTSAKFGFIFPKVGLCGADMGAAYLLPRVVGLGRALHLALSGEEIDAEEAERIGLVSRVVAPDRLLAEAEAFARRIASYPRAGVGWTKRTFHDGLDLDFESATRLETEAEIDCFRSVATRERFQAFVDRKRNALDEPN